MFPRALLAPELMWTGGADADRYRLHMSAANFHLTVYTDAMNPSRYTPPQALWNAIGASAAGGTLSVDLRRLDSVSGNAYVTATQTWTVADANLRGSIYYWAVREGRIVQLDVSSGTHTVAFDSGSSSAIGTPTPLNASMPESPPWENDGSGGRCVACHAVSKNGSKLSAVFARASSPGPIGIVNFSPDASQVFYQRGSYSRAKYGTNMHGIDDLYVSTAVTNGTQLALDAANGKGVLSADSLHLNYAPTVNPISSAGYTRVVFTSPRDYGNRMQSPQGAAPMDATYQNRKQLRVTAVDAKLGIVDRSHPSFWLPGQHLTTINMVGYWALSPCKPTGGGDMGAPSTCAAGFECCSGFCRDEGSGPMCVDAPMGCHQEGEKCATASDCCNSISCTGGICQQIVQ